MANLMIIGELQRMGGEKLKIVEIEGERFFCKDPETFALADVNARYGQKIHRVIGRTFFYTKGTIQLYAFNDEQKNTLSLLQEQETDENLVTIVSLCDGADSSDVEKFRDCTHIEIYKELPQLGSNLAAGLGFPGKGLGLVVAEFDSPFERRRVFLQVVHSYSEGYSVEHQQLTHELLAFAHEPEVKNLFEK